MTSYATSNARVSFAKTVWELDAKWVRVEALDETGESLGVVTFEPNTVVQSAPSSRASGTWDQICRMRASFRSMVRKLTPSRSANSTLS